MLTATLTLLISLAAGAVVGWSIRDRSRRTLGFALLVLAVAAVVTGLLVVAIPVALGLAGAYGVGALDDWWRYRHVRRARRTRGSRE